MLFNGNRDSTLWFSCADGDLDLRVPNPLRVLTSKIAGFDSHQVTNSVGAKTGTTPQFFMQKPQNCLKP